MVVPSLALIVTLPVPFVARQELEPWSAPVSAQMQFETGPFSEGETRIRLRLRGLKGKPIEPERCVCTLEVAAENMAGVHNISLIPLQITGPRRDHYFAGTVKFRSAGVYALSITGVPAYPGALKPFSIHEHVYVRRKSSHR